MTPRDAKIKKRLRGRLRAAREIKRLQGAALGELSQGFVTLRDVLESPSDALKHVPVHRVLEHAPGMGDDGVKKVLTACNIYALDRLGSLNREERQALLENLPPRALKTLRRAKY